MCVNNLSKVALDSAAAGIESATSSRKSNALTTAPPSHSATCWALLSCSMYNLYNCHVLCKYEQNNFDLNMAHELQPVHEIPLPKYFQKCTQLHSL